MLFTLSISASAQNQRSSASQVIAIKIQKVTLLKFPSIHPMDEDIKTGKNEGLNDNRPLLQKDIIVTVFEDETYVKRKEESTELDEPIAVTTQSSQ